MYACAMDEAYLNQAQETDQYGTFNQSYLRVHAPFYESNIRLYKT